MLNEQQVDKFLRVDLGLSSWKLDLQDSRLNFLFKLDKSFKLAASYETISWGSKSFKDLTPPTKAEAIHQVLNQRSGACLQLNYVLFLLLEHLGYNASLIATQTMGSALPNDHLLVVARLPKLNSCTNSSTVDHYLLDVGWVRPFPKPIHLETLPFRWKAGGFSTECRCSGGKFEVVMIDGDPLKGPFEEAQPKKYCEFDLTPKSFEDFEDTMTQIFNNPYHSYFLHTASLSRFLSLDEVSYNFVNFIGRTMTILTPDSRQVKKFDTYMEMLPEISFHFRYLSVETLKRALQNYEERQITRKLKE